MLLSKALMAVTAITANLVVAPLSHATADTPIPPTAVLADRIRNPCTSVQDPSRARLLGTGIEAATKGRTGTESIAVFDRTHRITCGLAASRHFDTASTVKVIIAGTLLRRAAGEHRWLTRRERGLAVPMITRSANGPTSALWAELGHSRVRRFVRAAGLTRTRLAPDEHWGLTQSTARDQRVMLQLLTARHSRVLSQRARRYILQLMGNVIPNQRWGTPAGAGPAVHVHVKNGWVPRHGRSWRVHSIGTFDGPGRDYGMVVLTRDAPSMAYAISTIERISRVVHRVLR